MNQNPQKPYYFKQYCKKHPSNMYEYVCDRQNCDYYLNFECFQCRQDNNSEHTHQCPKTTTYTKYLQQKVIQELTASINKNIDQFQRSISHQINIMRNNLSIWFTPMQQNTTQKQFVHTVENPSKWEKIKQTSDIKASLINGRLRQIFNKYRRQMQEISNVIELQMNELRYRNVPLQWRFDKNASHQWVNITGFKDKTADKKSQKQKFCVAIVNQPLCPLKNEINFVLNSQNQHDHFIVLGVCSKRQLAKLNFQSDLKKGVYAIYQASRPGSYNNAFSLHNSNDQMHFKQAVGWNFRSGDSININYQITENDDIRIQFKKKKQIFQLFVPKYNGFLHPFVALYGTGDKVSIEFL